VTGKRGEGRRKKMKRKHHKAGEPREEDKRRCAKSKFIADSKRDYQLHTENDKTTRVMSP